MPFFYGKPTQQNMDEPETGNLSERKIACMSWCTANQKVVPILFKYIGEDQMVYTVKDIHVKHMDVHPNGFHFNEYVCEASIGGFIREFRLRHTPSFNKWVMLI